MVPLNNDRKKVNKLRRTARKEKNSLGIYKNTQAFLTCPDRVVPMTNNNTS